MLGARKMMGRRGGGIEFVAGHSSVNTGTGIGISGGAQNLIGDLLVSLAASDGSNAVWSTPAVFAKTYDPGSGADVAAFQGFSAHNGNWGYSTSTSTSNNKAFACLVFRGAAFALAGSGATRSGTGNLVLPSITMPEGGILIALIGSANAAATHSVPTGMTQGAQTPGIGYPRITGFLEEVGAGASGSRTVSVGGTPGNSAGLLMGIIKA